jgi:FkbM family methyltransferase
VLHAFGLARAAEVDHERRLARSIREAERARAQQQDDAARAKIAAVELKLRRTHEQFKAEHTSLAAALDRLREYREQLVAKEAQLRARREIESRIESRLAESLACVRRLRSVYDSPEERLLSQLRIGADVARRPAAPETAAREALLLDRSRAYAHAAACWRAGGRPDAVRHTSIAGLCWSVPDDSSEEGSLAGRIIERGWLPLDDVAIVRQFVVGGVMIDVGANVGTTSIPRAVLGDFACVYAAEPNTENFLCLVGNVVDNHLTGRVLPDRVAISSTTGTARLRRSKKIGGHQLVRPGARTPADFEEVPCFTLDDWIEHIGIPARDVRFVKVDTQGWDLHVLQGATQLLNRRDTAWQIEVSPGLMKGARSTVADLCALVAARFTHVKELGGHTGGRWRPSSDLAVVLEALPDDRRFANLLLFNMA